MTSFVALCQDLFLLSQWDPPGAGPSRGFAWERRIADYLARKGAPVETLPGGCRIFGHASVSGLAHQIDGTIACGDALVIGEWKAHRGRIPKNELLRFKAATDDYFMGLPHQGVRRPIMRVFGGAGHTSRELRTYAALHGITLIEPSRWPAPTLATSHLAWPSLTSDPPSAVDRRRFAWLSRPLQHVLSAQPDGSYRVPAAPRTSMVGSALDLQDEWSDRLWEAFDENPGTLEALLGTVPAPTEEAA